MTDTHVLYAPPRASEQEMATPIDPVATSTGQDSSAQKAVAALKVGMKISGRYLLLSRLAIGGMGEVWQALDEKTSERLALKILRPELAGKKLFLSRLRIEAYNASRVHHPNLAAVQASGEDAGLGWIRMELVDGVSLTEILDRQSILDTDFLLSVLYQTADALAAVHAAGIVHRDIKPGNIMVTPSGVVKLTDFGISKAAGQVNLTQVGMVMGTAQYLPPEQAMGQPATPAGDLYALGIIAYEALAGKRPFTGEKPVDIAFAHVNKPVPPLPESVPNELRELVMELLEKEPQLRPESACALMNRIEAVHTALLNPPSIEVATEEEPQASPLSSPETESCPPATYLSAEELSIESDIEPAALTPAPDVEESSSVAASDSLNNQPPAKAVPREEDGSEMLYLSGGTVPAPQLLPPSIPLPENTWQQRVRLRARPREFAALIPPVSASRPHSQMKRLRAIPQVLGWGKPATRPRYAAPAPPEKEPPHASLAAPLISWSKRIESQVGLRETYPLAAQVAKLRRPYDQVQIFSKQWWNQDISRAQHGRLTRLQSRQLIALTLVLWLLLTALSLGACLLSTAGTTPTGANQQATQMTVSEQKEETWLNLHTV